MKCYFLSLKAETPNRDYWDYGLVEDLIAGRLWKPYNFPTIEAVEVSKLPKDDTAIVVIPARHHAGLEAEINAQLRKINKGVLFLLGDEEADFDVDFIDHPKLSIWVQNAHPDKHDKYNRIGTGYPPQIRQLDGTEYTKDINVFFSGQVTHKNREAMVDGVLDYENSEIHRTKGFTQGMAHNEYYDKMRRAKVVPCPAGAVIPDSFRTYEALEAMAIPVADDTNSQRTIGGYWDWLFNDIVPFPRINNPDEWYGKIDEEVKNYTEHVQDITAWWIAHKRNLVYKVMGQLK